MNEDQNNNVYYELYKDGFKTNISFHETWEEAESWLKDFQSCNPNNAEYRLVKRIKSYVSEGK